MIGLLTLTWKVLRHSESRQAHDYMLSSKLNTASFTRFWNKTPYANCSNKPTVHDFRFSYVVSRMNLWAEAGVDLQVMMPYLSRYLGHKSTNETFYYYYLVMLGLKEFVKTL